MSSARPMRIDTATLILFALILLFGGAAQFFLVGDIVTRFAAVGLIARMLFTMRRQTLLPRYGVAVAILIAVPVFQLVPLPGSLWSVIPGNASGAAIWEAAGVDGGWQQLSIAPTRTFDSLLFLIVPLAAFSLGMKTADRARRQLLSVIVGIAALSLMLGVIQLLQGPGGSAFIYAITNEGSAVGLFANRNHHGIFLACTILLLNPLAAYGANRTALRRAAVLAAALLFVGVLLTQSRAASGLGLCALVTFVWQYLAANKVGAESITGSPARGPFMVLGLIGGAALLAIALSVAEPVLDRFALIGREGFNRAEVYPIMIGVWQQFWLFGSGLGSFEWAASAHENRETVSFTYWNHAHNDVAQLVLETGLFGVAAIGLGLAWLHQRVRALPQLGQSATALGTAAIGVIVLLALHSLVDYPLRTPAMSALFF